VLNLANANLANANLKLARLTNVSSGGIATTPSVLPVSWQLINGYLIGPKANLANAVLDDADLEDAILTEANLTNATLNRTNLEGASLAGANLTGAVTSNARLISSILTGANLTNAQITNSFPFYVISGRITGVPSELPSGWDLINGYLVGKRANLEGADLAGAHININVNVFHIISSLFLAILLFIAIIFIIY
jgi:hypothetical protein